MQCRIFRLFAAFSLFSMTVYVVSLFTFTRECLYRKEDLCYTEAICSAVGTTITCTGEGSVTEELVKQTGVRTKCEIAQIEWGITRIDNNAFRYCHKLRDITIPEGVVYIGDEAFSNNSASSITFPSSLTHLSVIAVNACAVLTHVNMAFQNGTYTSVDGMIFLSNGLYIVGAGRCRGSTLSVPPWVSKIQSSALTWNGAAIIQVPDSVTEIQSRAFYSCPALHTLELGKGLQSLNSGAFEGCITLKTIILHSENSDFYHTNETFGKKHSGSSAPQSIHWVCLDAKKLTIPGTVTEIGITALQRCPDLTSITVESTSTTFSCHCNGLVVCTKDGSVAQHCAGGAVHVVIDEVVKFLDVASFRGLSRLETVTFHPGVIGCGWSCFRDCFSLHTVDFASCTMRNSMKTTYAHVFSGSMFLWCHSLKTILNWPTNNFSMEYGTFMGCAFENLVLPRQLTYIDDKTFSLCLELHTVTIPMTLTNLASLSFASCTQLKNIIFEAGSRLAQIDSLAVSNCTQLSTVTLPDSIKTIDPTCFYGDTMLTSIKFEANTGVYRSDNIAVYKDTTFCICPPGVSSVRLREETRVIATHAFYECSKLVHVEMNNLVETIETSAFLACAVIESVRLTGNIRFIGASAFNTCFALQYIFFCGSSDVQYESDPFPTKPSIYLFHDSQIATFCGHTYYAILDHQCHIPTNRFTSVTARVHTEITLVFLFTHSIP